MEYYKVAVWEYERGWGSKLDDWMICPTLEDALEFKEKFNSENEVEGGTPDWYMVCKGDPVPVDLNATEVAIIKEYLGNCWESELKSRVKQYADTIKLCTKEQKGYTTTQVEKIAHEIMNLGMDLRQSQLNGTDGRSGKEVLEEYLGKLAQSPTEKGEPS